jgi:hypothetical protein
MPKYIETKNILIINPPQSPLKGGGKIAKFPLRSTIRALAVVSGGIGFTTHQSPITITIHHSQKEHPCLKKLIIKK